MVDGSSRSAVTSLVIIKQTSKPEITTIELKPRALVVTNLLDCFKEGGSCIDIFLLVLPLLQLRPMLQ